MGTHAKKLSILAAVCFLVRVIPAFAVYGTSDVNAWRIFADYLQSGPFLGLYEAVHPNYPPLVPVISYLALLVSDLTGLPFWGLVKLPSIAADCLTACLIYRGLLNSGRTEKGALLAAALFVLNPVSILVTSVHGQYDPFTMLFCALAWYQYEFGERPRGTRLSALLLGIAILAKNFPAILLPLFLLREEKNRDRLVYAAIACLPAALSLLPFLLVTPDAILGNVGAYSSRFGHWGYMLLLGVLHNHSGLAFIAGMKPLGSAYGKYLLVACLGLYYFRTARKKRPLLDDIISLFLVFYCLTAGFGIQYLVWIVPFAALRGERKFGYYTLFSGLWMIFWYLPFISGRFYSFVSGISGDALFWKAATAFSLLSWLTCIAWLIERETKRVEPAGPAGADMNL